MRICHALPICPESCRFAGTRRISARHNAHRGMLRVAGKALPIPRHWHGASRRQIVYLAPMPMPATCRSATRLPMPCRTFAGLPGLADRQDYLDDRRTRLPICHYLATTLRRAMPCHATTSRRRAACHAHADLIGAQQAARQILQQIGGRSNRDYLAPATCHAGRSRRAMPCQIGLGNCLPRRTRLPTRMAQLP